MLKRHIEYYKWNTVVSVMDILRFVNCMKDSFRMKVSFVTIYKMLKSQVFWDVMMCQWGIYQSTQCYNADLNLQQHCCKTSNLTL